MAIAHIIIDHQADKKLMKKLAKLGVVTARKVVRPAAIKSMKPMLQAAKANAPTSSDAKPDESEAEALARSFRNTGAGALKKSLGSRSKSNAKQGLMSVWIGPRLNARKTTDVKGKLKEPFRYAHLVEGGTAPHTIRTPWPDGVMKTIKHPGARPNAFLRRAFFAKETETVKLLAKFIGDGIKREAAKP